MHKWTVFITVVTVLALGWGAMAAGSDIQWERTDDGKRALVFAEPTVTTRGQEGEAGDLDSKAVTALAQVYVDRRTWLKDDFIDMARLTRGGGDDQADLAVRATVTNAGFFGNVWRIALVSETGLLGDSDVVALPGLERHLLQEEATYDTVLSYNPLSGQISVRLTVRDEEDGSRDAVSGNGAVLVDGVFFTQPTVGGDDTRWSAGVGVASAQLDSMVEAVRVDALTQRAGFEAGSVRLALHGARAVVRSSQATGSGKVLLTQDPLVFVILREPGWLPGSYRLDVTSGPDMVVDSGTSSGEAVPPLAEGDAPLFQVAADAEVVEVDLGVGAMPAGTYTGDVTYVEYGSDGDVLYRHTVATVGWEVVPPMVDVGFELSGRTMQTMTGLPAQLRGHVVLHSNQPARDVHVVVTTNVGDQVVDATRETIRRGETRIPFAWTVEDEGEQFVATVTGADGMPEVRHVFSPFGVPDALLTAFNVHVEVASYFGDAPQQTAMAGQSLVRVWAEAPLNVAEVGDVVVDVRFTSPSGRVIQVPARRVTLRENVDPRKQPLTMKMTGLKWAQIQATDQRHWFADIKPTEPGLWRYKVDVINPHARLEHFSENPLAHEATKYWRWHDGPQFPGRFTVAEGVFDVDVSAGVTAGEIDAMAIQRLTYIDDSTVKLEQVTGDWDKHLHRPTITQTLSRASVAGTDLGRSFEHDGDLILLFGDTVGPDGFIQSFIARSTTKDPEAEGGLSMDVYTEPFRPGVALRLQPPGIGMGGFEVPTGGISLNGNMYILVRTSFQDPHGRSVLLVFDEARSLFRVVREFSPLGGKFTEVEMRRSPEPIPGLPDDEQWVLLWGTGQRYRQSPVYLGAVPADAIEESGVTKYFAGFNVSGEPIWGDDESDAVPVIAGNVGEFSIIRVPELNIWVSMHADLVSWSKHPWGPWSPFVHLPIEPVAADAFQYRAVSDKYLAGPTIGPEDPYRQGGPYGHYMIERFTQVHEDVLRLYYLISTWNPYEVVLMRSDLRVEWE